MAGNGRATRLLRGIGKISGGQKVTEAALSDPGRDCASRPPCSPWRLRAASALRSASPKPTRRRLADWVYKRVLGGRHGRRNPTQDPEERRGGGGDGRRVARARAAEQEQPGHAR